MVYPTGTRKDQTPYTEARKKLSPIQTEVRTVMKKTRKMMMEDHQPRKQRTRENEMDLKTIVIRKNGSPRQNFPADLADLASNSLKCMTEKRSETKLMAMLES